MLNATTIVFIVIFVLEAVFIIIGNTFTIFVFWTQRFHLKRTCFLLINLAVADLLVGITEPIVLGMEKIPKGQGITENIKNPSSAFQVLGSSTSVFFLALISLERVHAVLWPLRHRVINTRAYIYSIVTVWAAGFCMAGLMSLPIYHTDGARRYGTVIIHLLLFISLLVICASYLAIRSRLRCTTSELEVHNRNSTELNLRFSRTFFMVVAGSLMFWLPAFTVYIIQEFCRHCFSQPVVSFVNALHLANSMVNPLVYSFRMPLFKDSFKKCWRKRRLRHDKAESVFNTHL